MIRLRQTPCGWMEKDVQPDIERLHDILKCAAGHGCFRCVECSERALVLMMAKARRGGSGDAAAPAE